MAPLLEKIINAKETSPFVLIKDTLEQSGQVLGLELLGATSPEKVIVDCYSNPLGWTGSNAAGLQKGQNGSDLVTVSLKNIRKATKVISNAIASQSSRIIAVHHEDVPDATSFQPDGSSPLASNSLAHIATTLITLKSSESIRRDQEDLRKGVVAVREFCYLTANANSWESAVCEIEHKRKSGKVAKETNAYHLGSPTGSLVVVNVWDVVGDMPDIDKLDLEESQTADPAANLSFNLNLTEEQRRAKDATVLPYLKTQETTGAIYYEPDAADDFDDDDPDDDLTI
ncbi:Elongator complex protein [Gryganskiella cystojenkinii]|nr:Elongator complex protein [Gryganskiella cystojenkinii]